jgi:hypothetical protein
MGLFDKLKSLVSDDKKDTGTIEIVAPSPVRSSTLKTCRMWFLRKKLWAMGLPSNRLATKWSRR